MSKDPYAVLELSPGASADEIKSAYRRLAMKYHPDRNKDHDADGKFKEVSEAYEYLTNPDKRHSVHASGGGVDFNDFGFGFFNPFAQWKTHRQAPRKGESIQIVIELELSEVFNNQTKNISYQRYAKCNVCLGSGLKSGKSKSKCRACNGEGQQSRTTRQAGGIFREIRPCQECQATGISINEDDKCEQCKGSSFQLQNHTLSIEIPAGINEGIEIYAKNEGHAGVNGGPPGDVQMRFRIREHPSFTRDNNNLIRNFNISYVDACLGKTERVDLPDGTDVGVHIPPLSQHDSVVVITQRGIPDIRSKVRGDLHIVVKIQMPKNITEEYKLILKQLAELEKNHD